jgi:hypothetical protein
MKPHLQKMLRAVGTSLVAILLLAVAAQSVRAQSEDPQKQQPEVQQLKDRVKQLEQTVEELKGQIGAIEETRRNSDVAVGETVATPSTAPITGELPAEQPAAKTAEKKQSGGNTFEVYGFAMLDMGYQFKQNHPDWFDVIRPTKLPSFKDEFGPDGHTYFGVRQTRLGVRSSTPTKYGDLKTLFEFELFGTGVDAGQTTFRLRHAYGELGQFGAGQTWSPFMDIDVFPNTVEYWGPVGMVFFRNVQARWMPIKGRSRVTIALERPGASGDQGVFADRIELQGIKPKFAWPDLSWEARYGKDWGYVELAGIFRSIRWVDTNDDQFDLGGSDLGWGLNLSSNLNFTKNDIGRFQVVYGEGIQNYMNDAPVDVGIKNNLSAGDPRRPIKGVALPVLGVVAFLDHNWNKRFSTSVGYSMENISNSDAQASSAFRRGHYGIANLLFYPADRVMVGGEFQWGRRENFRDGFTADDFRIQISMKYNFSKLWEF